MAALSAAALVSTATPAVADTAWFAPAVSTPLNNGPGPGPAPRGTVSADFNGDGRPDIVTIGDFTFGNLLFIPNTGGGNFGTPVAIPNTSGVQGIDAGDVNGDGKPDVVAMTTSQVIVLFGNGDGTFSQGGTYPLTLGGQVEPRLVDLNGDGSLDIVAPTFTAIQTLINNGHGQFTAGPTTQVPGASVLSAISPANLNRDNKADLFATDGFSGTTYALTGKGNGGFTVTGMLYATSFVPEDVAAIDLNGDGCDDVALVGSFSFTLTTALTNCHGGFTSLFGGTIQYGGPGPTSLTAADFNGDGKTDLAVSSLATPNPEIMVLRGNGTASMQLEGNYPVSELPQNPVVADFTGDGKPDIVTVEPGAMSLLRNIS